MDSYAHKLGAHDAEAPFTPAVQQASKRYQVQYGYMRDGSADFATFAEALAFYRGYTVHARGGWGAAIINLDKCDFADDAANPTGLTDEEKEQLGEFQ